MKENVINKARIRLKRGMRVRNSLHGSSMRPRLCVVKTNKHLQAQLIDDEHGVTLGAVSTYSPALRSEGFGKKNKESARKLGEVIAEIAQKKNIKQVVFDRGPFKYHGILAELANAARAAGLEF